MRLLKSLADFGPGVVLALKLLGLLSNDDDNCCCCNESFCNGCSGPILRETVGGEVFAAEVESE